MVVEFTPAVWTRLWKEARLLSDIEVCGAIIDGRHPIMMANRSTQPASSYVFDTVDQKYVWQQWKDKSQPLVLFHSHPNGAARPSDLDIKYARNKGVLYLILSLSSVNAMLYHIEDGQVTTVPFKINGKCDGWRGHQIEFLTSPSRSANNDSRMFCVCGAMFPVGDDADESRAWWVKHLIQQDAEPHAVDYEERWAHILTGSDGRPDREKVAKALFDSRRNGEHGRQLIDE